MRQVIETLFSGSLILGRLTQKYFLFFCYICTITFTLQLLNDDALLYRSRFIPLMSITTSFDRFSLKLQEVFIISKIEKFGKYEIVSFKARAQIF